MKKQTLYPICAVIYAGLLLLGNCSRPLESSLNEPPTSLDSIIIVDTVIISEPAETVIVADTVIHIDTVIVLAPDTGRSQVYCSTLDAHHQEIVWMLQNRAERYRLEFHAAPRQGQPPQNLAIDIDHHRYLWRPSIELNCILDAELGEDATIKIMSIPPHAYGHAIDICLTVRVI